MRMTVVLLLMLTGPAAAGPKTTGRPVLTSVWGSNAIRAIDDAGGARGRAFIREVTRWAKRTFDGDFTMEQCMEHYGFVRLIRALIAALDGSMQHLVQPLAELLPRVRDNYKQECQSRDAEVRRQWGEADRRFGTFARSALDELQSALRAEPDKAHVYALARDPWEGLPSLAMALAVLTLPGALAAEPIAAAAVAAFAAP